MKKKSIALKGLALLLALSLMPVLPMSFSASDFNLENLQFEKTDPVTNAHFDDGLPAKDELEDAPYDGTDVVRASIVLEGKPTLDAGFDAKTVATDSKAIAYRNTLREEQNKMTDKISAEVLGGEELDVVWNLTLAANIISANVEFSKLLTIKDMPGVKDVMIETRYMPAVVDKDEAADPNMATSSEQIGTSFMWSAGFTGVGRRIAIIDTGVDWEHISFNSAAFEFSLNSAWSKDDYDSFEDFKNAVLMDADDIAPILEELNAYDKGAKDVKQLYKNSKFPFAFNYIDGNYNVGHEKDTEGEHGSHVTGIVSANSYILDSVTQSFKKAIDTVRVQGVAPDAQILPMKVFGEGGGAYDSDYFAAVEDAIALGCDSANLSLGSAFPGWSNSTGYQALLDKLTEYGLVMVTSAGNNGSAADYTNPWFSYDDAQYKGYLYGDDVSFHTGGSPGSFKNTFAVASVENVGLYLYVNGEPVNFTETAGDYGFAPFESLFGAELEYVYIDDVGSDAQFAGIADQLKGKVAVCNRGTTDFSAKANAAVKNGAIAVIVVNNQEQDGVFYMNLSDYTGTAPAVFVELAYRELFMSGKKETVADGVNVKEYYTGSVKVGDRRDSTLYGDSHGFYTMSDFSAWGVPQNLTLKPEITAPGGNIYSVNGSHDADVSEGGVPNVGTHDAYEVMSGTSMAAPQVTGMVALVDQYISEKGYDEQEGLTLRQLALSLLMSTAEPMEESFEGTNSVGLTHYYYPVLRQGAGLANVGNVLAALSYIMMGEDATESYTDGKVKAELGANEDGEFHYSFTLNNLDGEDHKYTLSSDLFTQDLFEIDDELFLDTYTTPLAAKVTYTVNGVTFVPRAAVSADVNKDGVTDSADALAVLRLAVELIKKDDAAYDFTVADLNSDGAVTTYDAYLILKNMETASFTVPANESVTVMVDIEVDTETLADYVNGAYLEGYTFVNPVSGDGETADVTHSIPLLGFVGNWSDPSMYDQNSYIDSLYGDDTIPYINKPASTLGGRYIYQSNFLTYTDPLGGKYPFIGNPYGIEETFPADKAAMNSNSKISQIVFTLIRNAAAMGYIIKDADTDQILYASNPTTYGQNNTSAYYRGLDESHATVWANDQITLTINKKLSSLPSIKNGTTKRVSVSFVAVPELYLTDDILAAKEGEAAFTVTADEFVSIIPKLGEGAFLTSTFKIDDEAPKLEKAYKDLLNNDDLVITASDNEDIAYIAVLTRSGTKMYDEVLAPEEDENGKVVYTFKAAELGIGSKCTLLIADYAGNESTYTIKYGGEDPDYTGQMFAFVGSNMTSYVKDINHAWVTIDPDTLSYNSSSKAYTGIKVNGVFDGVVTAAEQVNGYVFFTVGTGLYVSELIDIAYPQFIADLSEYGISSVEDMAYNSKDGKLYAMCPGNTVYTINMLTGEAEKAFTVENGISSASYKKMLTLAIDDNGNFYSASYYGNASNPSRLFTWTAADIADNKVTLDYKTAPVLVDSTDGKTTVREGAGSLAWDHINHILYLANSYNTRSASGYTMPDTNNYLWEVNTATGEATKANSAGGSTNDAKLYFAARGLFIAYGKLANAPDFSETSTVSDITLSTYSVDLMVGGSEKVTYRITPWTLSDKTLNWTSEKPDIATVDKNGVITGVGAGTTTVKVTSNADPTVSKTISVTVSAIPSMTLSAIIYADDNLAYHADFDTSKTESWKPIEKVKTGDLQYLGGTLVNDKLYMFGFDSALYEIDADTFEPNNLGTVGFPIVDAAAVPTFIDDGYYFVYPTVYNSMNLLLLGAPYNLANHNQASGWNFSSKLTNGDNIAVVAYAYTDVYEDADEGIGDYVYMLTEKGELWELVFCDGGSMASGKIGMIEGVDLTGISEATGNSFASLAYKTFEGKEYLVLTSYIDGVDEDSAKMQLIDMDAKKVVSTTSFGEGVWPVISDYEYERLTDLTVLLDKTDIDLYEGAKATVNARVKLYKSDSSVEWTTDDESVATVDQNGVITAVGEGNATITATAKEKNSKNETVSASVTVNVTGRTELKTDASVGAQLADGTWVKIPLSDPTKFTEFKKTEAVFSGGGYDAEDGKLYGSDADLSALGKDSCKLYSIDPKDGFKVHEGSEIYVFYAPVDLTYAPKINVTFDGLGSCPAFGAPMYIPMDSNTPSAHSAGRGMIMLEDIDEGLISGVNNLAAITKTGNLASAVAFDGAYYWRRMVSADLVDQIDSQYVAANEGELFYVINADTLYGILWIPILVQNNTGALMLSYLTLTLEMGTFGTTFPDDTAVSMDSVDIDGDDYTDGLVIAYYGDGMPLLYYIDLMADKPKAEYIGMVDSESVTSLFFYSNGTDSAFPAAANAAKLASVSDVEINVATAINTVSKTEVMAAGIDTFGGAIAASSVEKMTTFKAAEGEAKNKSTGSLNAADAPAPAAEETEEKITVDVNAEDTTNGLYTVEYDPTLLKLVSVDGKTALFAYNDKTPGVVKMSFASLEGVDGVLATLTFVGVNEKDDDVKTNVKSTTEETGEPNDDYEPETETTEVTVSGVGHTYGEPKFKWSEDNKSATAVFECENGDSTEKVEATVTSEVKKAPTCTEEGTMTYTATVEFGGKKYTETKESKIAATGEHTFENGKCTVCGADESAKAPQTGDASTASLWFTLMLGMAGLAIAVCVPKKSKKGAK